MRIAVEGCCHGELTRIYDTIRDAEKTEGYKVDLLLCCGDFQALRNESDLCSMAVPAKFKHMGSFYQYYTGEKVAPILTIVIHGNHEASSYLWEMPYGGWLAPNIWYLGHAGMVNYGGLRIGGLSGIYNDRSHAKGHYETPPFDDSTMRSFYHVRALELWRLKRLQNPCDIFLTHDWPHDISKFGDQAALLRRKSFLTEEIKDGSFGNPAAEELLHHLKPLYHFAGHMHVKFAAIVPHDDDPEGRKTRFLALDKCQPGRGFLQLLEVASPEGAEKVLKYDAEWLAVLRETAELSTAFDTTRPFAQQFPGAFAAPDYQVPAQTREAIDAVLAQEGDDIPENFAPYVPAYNPHRPAAGKPAKAVINPQTTSFCTTFGIADSCSKLLELQNAIAESGPEAAEADANPDEINIAEDAEDELAEA